MHLAPAYGLGARHAARGTPRTVRWRWTPCDTGELPPLAGPATAAEREGASQTVRQAARLLAAFPAEAEETALGAPRPGRKDQGAADHGI
ncbi:hypothetical protein [Streptomyces sp. SM11]|uniref:hypothetical protein n=1 Tax=Streptomyces sp. SM11 TaxID=565557 RepID=UPI0011B049A2|nr:hypothetical protein [Streptomyces sp. SM11]